MREASQVRGAREESGVSTEAKQAADQGAGSTGSEGKQPDTKQADAPKLPTPEEWAKVQKALSDRNAENKALREAKDAESAAKALAEKAKAEAEGNVVKLREIEQSERKKLEADLAEFKSKASLADEYGAAITGRVESLAAKLSEDDRKLLAAVPVGQRLALAERLAGGTQPGAAGARSVGAAGQTQMPVDLSKMTPEQARKAMRADPKLAEKTLSEVFAGNRDVYG